MRIGTQHGATLTPEQANKLRWLKNRKTRYEVVLTATSPFNEQLLLGYTHKSTPALVAMLRHHGPAIVARFSLGDAATFEVRKHFVNIGPAISVEFSGRTQRDAICNGELPYIGV